jgi:hypothetical protein
MATGMDLTEPAGVKPLNPTTSSCLINSAASSAVINLNAIVVSFYQYKIVV